MAMASRVVLYGSSLILAGVGESLRKYPQLDVVTVDASCTPSEPDLHSLQPSAVIVDLGVMARETAFELLRDHPNLLLIGLDPGGNRLLVLSGQQARTLTTEDLVRLIERSIGVPRTQGSQEQEW